MNGRYGMSVLANTASPQGTVPAGRKDDEGKLRFDLLDPEFEEQTVAALTHGAKEYGDNNWQHVEDPVNRYYAALRRHLAAWRKGEKVDPDSGLNHLAHVAANVMFLMHFECPGDKN